MQDAFRKLMAWLPLLFGIGFIAPLVAQALAALGHPAPWGVPGLALGLILGASWGFCTVRRGRWL
jgi:hypothetical protein